jgi:hypothetical protein
MLPDILTNTRTAKTKKGNKSETNLRWWVTLLMALGLALGTWNPTGYHFIHYISSDFSNILSGFTPFAIILMLGVWILAIKSVFQSIGWGGTFFVLIIIGAFLWGLNSYGFIQFNNLTQMGWAGTLSVAFIIWVGINASIIWKTLTGVYATDVVEAE